MHTIDSLQRPAEPGIPIDYDPKPSYLSPGNIRRSHLVHGPTEHLDVLHHPTASHNGRNLRGTEIQQRRTSPRKYSTRPQVRLTVSCGVSRLVYSPTVKGRELTHITARRLCLRRGPPKPAKGWLAGWLSTGQFDEQHMWKVVYVHVYSRDYLVIWSMPTLQVRDVSVSSGVRQLAHLAIHKVPDPHFDLFHSSPSC